MGRAGLARDRRPGLRYQQQRSQLLFYGEWTRLSLRNFLKPMVTAGVVPVVPRTEGG